MTANSDPIPRGDLIYIAVAVWEYQCCADVPSVGQRVAWSLHADLPDFDIDHDEWAATPVRWDPRGERVWFSGGCAEWLSTDGVPPSRIALTAEWHAARPGVVAVGVIEELYQVTRLCRLNQSSNSWDPIADTRRCTPTKVATLWPDDMSFSTDTGEVQRQTMGVVAGVRITERVEPPPGV